MQEAAQLLSQTHARFTRTLGDNEQLQLALQQQPALQQELDRLWLASDHAATLCCNQPLLLLDLLTQQDLVNDYADWLQHLRDFLGRYFTGAADISHLALIERLQRQLRVFRQREWLRIVWRDVTGRATLNDTCRDLSALADVCIQHALPMLQQDTCHKQGVPLDSEGNEQQLIVLAMGKYGALELNLSSDIDLILAFPEDGETTLTPEWQAEHPLAKQCTHQYFFTRVGQQLLAVLDTVTPDGFVFRVDLRLRPYGSAGALALSLDALEQYYHSQGRDWERFAMIKVRAVTGDTAPVEQLQQVLRAFSYRRYLDFATIAAMRDLKSQIEQQVRRKGMQQNIKLGNGGIREIEFIVQVMQLIYGGRKKALQQPYLQKALVVLQQASLLPANDAAFLQDSYVFLRRLEHAIQALQDKQTHDYPADLFSEYRVARTLGYADAQKLRDHLSMVRAGVAQRFAELIRNSDEQSRQSVDLGLQPLWSGAMERERALALLSEKGFTDAVSVYERLENFRRSRQFLSLDRQSRERLDQFMPLLLTQVAGVADPTQAFLRVFTFVQAVVQRTVYLVLLQENPVALKQLVTLCAASPWVVELLSRYPVLLDELLRPLAQPPLLPELRSLLQSQLLRSATDDIEGQLNVIQHFKQEQLLNVVAAELSGHMPLMKVSDYLTWIAETLLEQVLQLAWQQLTARYGLPANSHGERGACDFVIIAYGKLGGLELSYGSDLDLVFLHDGHAELETSGGGGNQTVNSGAFYVQMGQKILALLGTQTLIGKLYEIDMRLRPSGSSGALVSSLPAFIRYQQHEAWTWEHQALVRSRVVAGSRELAGQFEQIRRSTLGRQRDLLRLQTDIVSMRELMLKQHGSKRSDRFDLKQDSGGLIDIEFMVQYLVLAHAAQNPAFLQWSDNMRLLDTAAATGVLSSEQAESLQHTYLTYRSELHLRALNLVGSVTEGDAFTTERQQVRTIWQQLLGDVKPAPLAKEGNLPPP